MRDLLLTKLKGYAEMRHIWWGVSVENQKHGLPRVDHLRQAPAHTRWLSVESLLEDVQPLNLDGIAWVVVGGENLDAGNPCKSWGKLHCERAK